MKGFAKLTPKCGRVSFTFILLFDVLWGPHYGRGFRYHKHFRQPIRLTNHNFHTHIKYCITFYYYVCYIDKYTYVEGQDFNNFERFGMYYFEYGGFYESHTRWESFVHIPYFTRCLYRVAGGLHLTVQCFLNWKWTMYYCSLAPDECSGGYIWLSTSFSIALLNISRWPYVVPFLATRCLYWGMSDCPLQAQLHSTTIGH